MSPLLLLSYSRRLRSGKHETSIDLCSSLEQIRCRDSLAVHFPESLRDPFDAVPFFSEHAHQLLEMDRSEPRPDPIRVECTDIFDTRISLAKLQDADSLRVVSALSTLTEISKW